MGISLINKTVASPASGTTVTIPATHAGNTLVIGYCGTFVGAPSLSGVTPFSSAGVDVNSRSAVFYLTAIAAGATSVVFPSSITGSEVVVYELSPVVFDAANAGVDNINGSEFGFPIGGGVTASASSFNCPNPNDPQGLSLGHSNEFVVATMFCQSQCTGCVSGSRPAIGISSISGGFSLDSTKTPFSATGNCTAVASSFGQNGFVNPTFSSLLALTSCGAGTTCAGPSFPAYGSWTGVLAGFYEATPAPSLSLSAGGGGGAGGACSTSSIAIAPATELYSNYISAGNIVLTQYLTEGRVAAVLDFNGGDGLYSRDFETEFHWGIGSKAVLRVWQPSLIPMPEQQYNRPTDWDDGGTPGAKYIQGIQVEADSFGLQKTFSLQSSDDLSLHALNEMPTIFPKQTIRSFSCVTPFIAHSARIVSTDAVAWRIWKSELVFQPWPSAAMNWQTELNSLGSTGWSHAREMNIAYASTASITIVLTFDAWPTITLTLPSTNGVQAKTKLTLPANKFKLIGFQVSSAQTFYLFERDLEVKVKQWGSTSLFQVLKVVGGPSNTGATV